MKILLITPPLLQPNTPYAATPLLTAWLKSVGHDAVQADLSLKLLLCLFSTEGIAETGHKLGLPDDSFKSYCDTVGPVLRFLQGRDLSATAKIAQRGYLPEGPNLWRAYEQEDQLGWNFRGIDQLSRACYLASLYLDDLADMASQLDPHFGFSRYAEQLAVSLSDFKVLRETLEDVDSLFAQWLRELTDEQLTLHKPRMVAITVPFPGCLVGSLIIAKRIKEVLPNVHVTIGGGYINTELRELKDPGIFDYVDSITLDSGFIPLQRLAENGDPVRTFLRKGGKVAYFSGNAVPVPHKELPPPDYSGLDLGQYFGLFEVLNPVTRLWSDGRWNKLVLAHGCCWSRCAFCDTSIDYIRRYDPADPVTICDWIETVMEKTEFNGFHFVDEALPPDLLESFCDEVLRRNLQIEWWGNIRFEKRFSLALTQKMASAGCIAVTGGLETCCDRTLRLMRKGITVRHASQVLKNLADCRILTHAYLMYGFPTQTEAETLGALETVRGLFDDGVLHSAYWHRFALTAHSPMSENPEQFGIELKEIPKSNFALNEIPFDGCFKYDLNALGVALKVAVYNYQLGIGLDFSVSDWLKIKNP
ncbi:MAG TPA: B12-binding domain-containing radical SAM protein [Pontiella sp.]